MLRASKLYQSVSTSGPSATWKPIPTNTSSRRSQACVTMCARPPPRLAEELGQVETFALDLCSASFAGQLTSLDRERVGDRGRRVVQLTAGVPALVHAAERPELGLQSTERAAPAEHFGVDRASASSDVAARQTSASAASSSSPDVVDQGGPPPRVSHGSCVIGSPDSAGGTILDASADATSTDTFIARAACRLEAQHRHGHRDVDALRPPVVLDAHPFVDRLRSAGGRAPRCRPRWRRARASPLRCVACPCATTCRAGAARLSARRRAPHRRLGRGTAEPADARTVLGLKGSTVPGVARRRRSRPPRPSAGSCRGCRDPRSGRRPRPAWRRPARRRRPAGSRRSPAIRVGVCVSLTRSATPRPRSVHRAGAVNGLDARAGVLAFDVAAGGHRLVDQQPPLDDERAVLVAGTAAAEQAAQPLYLRVGEPERGRPQSADVTMLSSPKARRAAASTKRPKATGSRDREVGQDLAVDFDPGRGQAGDEPAVRQVVLPGRRVDALDPQPPELTLAGAPVAEGVLAAAHHLLVGGAERAALVAVVALGLLEDLLVAPLRDRPHASPLPS